jgi:uncharacterized transporter YbjL
MNITVILTILLAHWFSDFILQTSDMAMNKSKSNYWLSLHVFYYTIGMCMAGLAIWTSIGFSYWLIVLGWVLSNGVLHWITDYFTSRWTSKLYNDKKFYGFPSFFSVIGLDQFIHHATLMGTYTYILQ